MAEEIEDVVFDGPEVSAFRSGVGDRIRNIREFRGLSRRELGEAIGLRGNSAGTGVYALEMHGGATRIDTIFKVAMVLGVSPGFLLDGGDLRIEQVKTF